MLTNRELSAMVGGFAHYMATVSWCMAEKGDPDGNAIGDAGRFVQVMRWHVEHIATRLEIETASETTHDHR